MAKKLKIIENIIFIIGISIGVYALGTSYFQNRNLPPGVCPIANNRSLIYVSISLLLFSLIFPYISKKIIQHREK